MRNAPILIALALAGTLLVACGNSTIVVSTPSTTDRPTFLFFYADG